MRVVKEEKRNKMDVDDETEVDQQETRAGNGNEMKMCKVA